jgi:hypothetical protein
VASDDSRGKASDGMFKVWTDGLDVVVARDVREVPNVLNHHYRVTGHSLRHRSWQEVSPTTQLQLKRGANVVQTVTASALVAVASSCWVGRNL